MSASEVGMAAFHWLQMPLHRRKHPETTGTTDKAGLLVETCM